MCYGISENDDMAGQIEHDVTAFKILVSRALEDGEQLHIRQFVRIGARSGTRVTSKASQSQTYKVAVNRPRPLKVFFDSTDEAELFLSRSDRVRRSEPESKLGFQRDFALKERIEWPNRRQQLQQELEESRKNGETSLVLRGTKISHNTRLWESAVFVEPNQC